MRTYPFNLARIAAGLLALGCAGVFATRATAQPDTTRGRGFPLDDQQRQLFEQATQKDQNQLQELSGKLQAAQKELMKAVLDEKYNETAVKSKAEAVAAIQVQITLLRSKALATVAPTLKPDQKESLVESRFGAMMLSSGFNMMGRGRGQGGPPGNRGGANRPGRGGQ